MRRRSNHGNHRTSQAEDKEKVVLCNLCQLLRKNGNKIIEGGGKLSLTTESLNLLGSSLRRLSDNESMGLATAALRNNRLTEAWKEDAEFLRDFIAKATAIKIMHGSYTIQGAVHIERFRSLKVLEVKKVPLHMIEGLQTLRGQLTTVIISRSLQRMQDVFETCGGDMSAPMSWPHLKTACLSYNGIQAMDGSLRLLPSLEVLDVSHNMLDRTDKNLEYLTEMERLNLGYNCLDSLPTFSISCKAKMKTLIIKNNNLDNIEGIGELTALQELDISENCIADHICLQPLSHLSRLRRLSTEGNPIYYHKDHRRLTVTCLAWPVITTQFELDGKKLTKAELKSTNRFTQGGVSVSRRPSSIAHNVITSTERHSGDQTSSDTNISVESIATSLSVGAGRRKGKRKTKRFTQEITDLDSSATEVSSPEGSVASSPAPESCLADHVRTRMEVEMLRNQYGPNWLQVMEGHFSSDTGRSDASNSAASDSDTPTSKSSPKALNSQSPQTLESSHPLPTEDDLYLNETARSPDVTVDKIPEEKDEEHKMKDEKKTPHQSKQPSQKISVQVEDSPGFEWTRTEDEEIKSYGEETEPFIVLLKQRNCEQLLVSLNSRYILEKDLNGSVVERLDLKSLLTVEQTEDVVVHEDVVGEMSMPHLKLTFDYIRKDRRERVYIMENRENTEKMWELLQPFLQAQELKSLPKFIYQCLKCSHKFSKEEGKQSSQPTLPLAGNSKDLPKLTSQVSVMYKCPKCGSDHVIQIERSVDSGPSSAVSTPVGSLTSSGSFLSPNKHQRSSSQDFSQSPLARSTPQKQQKTEVTSSNSVCRNLYSSSADRSDPTTRPRSNALLGAQDLLDVSDGLAESQGSVTTPIENKAFRRESWPSEKHVSNTRIASQDSDITILTNPSEGSIAVISESSSETLSALTPLEDRSSLRDMLLANSKEFKEDVIIRSASEPKHFHIGLDKMETDEKTETTPMGSPLSNSICNSLVTSVYQNSGLTEVSDSNSNCGLHSDNVDIHKNGDIHSPSIYDSGISTSLPKDKRTSFREESGSISDSDAINVIPVKESDDSVAEEEEEEEVMTRARSSAISEQPFTHIDHQLKLCLMMKMPDDSEDFECIFKCDVCQYLVEEEYRCILVMTATKFYIFKVDPSKEVSECLTTLDNQPITELRHVDVGLGCQSFRMEFDTECSSYTFIVRDAERCKSFLEFLTGLLNMNILNQQKKLQVEYQHVPSEETMTDMRREVLYRRHHEHQKLELYLMGYLVRGQNLRYPVSFVLTNEAICVVKENHQWPQPRLQAPLDVHSNAKHFTVLERQPINNIATVEIYEMDKTKLKISFFNEQTGLETKWQITMETTNGVQSLVDGLRHPWEEEFGVELDVTMIPFSDQEDSEEDQ